MKIIVSAKDRISDLNDLSFCEKFQLSLNRARLEGKCGITQREFATHVGVSDSSISKVKKDPSQSNSRAKKEMEKLIDIVL